MDGIEWVWQSVETFRAEYVKGEIARLPIDVITLAELELKLDLIPFDDLRRRFQVDAALTADFSGIYIDAESYLLIEAAPEWKLNRLRFSVAHELGHWAMHQDLFVRHGFKSPNEFVSWTQFCGGQKYEIEQQANEFAGRFLVPITQLQSMYDQIVVHFNASLPSDWKQDPDLRRKAAERSAPTFGVHPQVIEARFSRESLWPESF